jgi:REP element-mobilizing transposase RayT
VATVFAYALLPNHFHFLVAIKPFDSIIELYKNKTRQTKENDNRQPEFVMLFSGESLLPAFAWQDSPCTEQYLNGESHNWLY